MLYHTLLLALLASTITAAPTPQGVTEAIKPGTEAPESCKPSYDGTFGMTVMNSTSSTDTTQMGDGQANAGQETTQIPDGQVQATNQIADGQVQNQAAAPANQIGDGQVQQQAGAAPANQIADGQVQNPTNQIADGQVQQQANPTNQIADGQVQQQANPTNQIGDGQVQQQASASNQIADGQVQQSGTGGGSAGGSTSNSTMTGCKKADSLTLTLQDGVLKDSQGRTGYIADNRQFQFDGPPQAGALVTAGWSTCDDGNLSLGNQTVFYQCLSGDFYNLYDQSQGEQCNEVNFKVLSLVDC